MPLLSRRCILQATAAIVVSSGVPPSYRVGHGQGFGAVSQPPSGSMNHLLASQRIVLGGLLYSDVPAYLAFADTIQKGLRGNAALQAFDGILSNIQQASTEERLRRLGDAIANGIVFDCSAVVSGQNTHGVSLQQIFSDTIPKIGIIGIIARQVSIDLSGIAPQTALKDPLTLAQAVTRIQLVPPLSRNAAPAVVAERLRLLTSDGGLVGVLAGAIAAVGSIPNAAAELQRISTAFTATTDSLKEFVDGIGKIGSGGSPNAGLNVSQLTNNLATSVSILGNAVGMSPSTIQKVNSAIKVAGSVLSGALAGASFGPVGAVVGGVIGLLGGLFGGGGEDPTLKALSQLDSRISQLQREFELGIQQLSVQLAQQFSALTQQISAGFESISKQIGEFQRRVEGSFERTEQILRSMAEQTLQDRLAALENASREYEFQFRSAAISQSVPAPAYASELRSSLAAILNAARFDGTGFCGPTFAGAANLEKALEKFTQDNIANRPLSSLLRYIENFAGGLPPLTAPPNVPGFPPPIQTLADLADAFALRLRRDRYEDSPGGESNAAAIRGIQQFCFDSMVGIETSPEGMAMSADQRALLPGPNASCPPPLAPQDMWRLLSAVRDANSTLSDTAAARELLSSALAFFSSRIFAHHVLVGQDLLPALFYIRRRIAASLARDAAAVFCNPYVGAIDIFRRAISTALSRRSNYGPGHSPLRISSLADAKQAMQSYSRSLMPLAGVTNLKFDGSYPETGAVDQEFARFFNALLPVPNNVVPVPLLFQAAGYTSAVFAARLPAVIRRIDGNRALTARLVNIRNTYLALGVVERCINARLSSLQAAGSAVPSFETWSEGFQEYGTVAAFALAQPIVDIPGTDPEFQRARALLGAFFDPPMTSVATPTLPAEAPLAAMPYPVTIGHFWGWGAEKCRPEAATDPQLVAALLRPECAFAGSNGAVMGAVAVFLEMQIAHQQFVAAPALVELAKQGLPGELRGELRRQLATS